jgi:hypothetical protein
MKEHPEMSIAQLHVGDTLLTKNGATVVYQLDNQQVNTHVYNITLSTGHTYYANAYQVHNFYDVTNIGGIGGLGTQGDLGIEECTDA